MFAIYLTLIFGLLGYWMRKLRVSVLPFVIAFILANNLEEALRQAYSATGGDAWFLVSSPLSIAFIVLAVAVTLYFARNEKALG